MTFLKLVVLTTALVGATGLGAASSAVGHGQSRAPRVIAPRAPRAADQISHGTGGRIGVSIRDVGAEDAKGQSPGAGIVIDSVAEDSAAEKAGLKKGDVVVEFDGERVRSVRQFTRLVTETPGGRTVTAAVLRDGSRVSLNITPRDASDTHFLSGGGWDSFETLRGFGANPPAIPARPVPPATSMLESFLWRGSNRLGVTVGELSPQLAEYFGTKEGVLVSAVDENSAASKAGVKAGDVITSLNGQEIANASELRRRLTRLDTGEEFSLGIVREKKTMTLKGKVDGTAERRRLTRTNI